jgi:hypothetical protein
MLKNVFARNADGSLKTKQPCQTKGCAYPNYHVCLPGQPITPEQLRTEFRVSILSGPGKVTSAAQQARVAEGRREAAARRYEQNYDRDMQIQELHFEYDTPKAVIARKFGISEASVRKALTRPVREFV